jgi:hypothetical protein
MLFKVSWHYFTRILIEPLIHPPTCGGCTILAATKFFYPAPKILKKSIAENLKNPEWKI